MAREVNLGNVVGPRGPAGPKGDKGDAVFALQVDANGNLYAYYPDGSTPPQFEYEKNTGNLYLVINE